MKFLHCMKERRYLEDALREGLLFRRHPVELSWSREQAEREMPALISAADARLRELGTSWEQLSEPNRHLLLSGTGSARFSLPMICLTEVPEGRHLRWQRNMFGEYGLVVTGQWVEANDGDRVIYAGENSPLTRRLCKVLAALRLQGVTVTPTGQVLFSNESLRQVIDLLTFVETRLNIQEMEWRVPGRHGVFGGGGSDGQRLPLPLTEVEQVLVPAGDVAHFEALLEGLVENDQCHRPPVRAFGDVLDVGDDDLQGQWLRL